MTTLRDAWTRVVSPDDYDRHMAAVGQAEANAHLLADLLAFDPPAAGSRVLIAGAGTGQMFDYVPASVFAPYAVTCTDINAEFLDRLQSRFACATVVDDVEDTQLAPGFALIALVLVLEHVDWRKALTSLSHLDASHLFIVTQRNPAEPVSVVREHPETMRVFFEDVHPGWLDTTELAAHLETLGYQRTREELRPVPDGKTMVGSLFRRTGLP